MKSLQLIPTYNTFRLIIFRGGYRLFPIGVNNYKANEYYGSDLLPYTYLELNVYGTYLEDLEYYKYTNTMYV